MPPIGKYLNPHERLVFAVRRHWAALAWDSGLLLLFLAGDLLVVWLLGSVEFIRVVATAFFVFCLLWFSWSIVDWYYERFVVTDKRVLLISGILTRNVGIMPLIKVTDLTFQRTLPGRLLRYGAFIMENAGQNQAFTRVDFLPRPEHLYQQMAALLFGPDAPKDPEDVPEWFDTAPVKHQPWDT